MTQQIGPYGVFNPNAQSIGGGVQNPSSSPPVFTGIAAWKMDEGSGLVLHDAIGTNTANINLAASVVWTPNIIKAGVTSPVWSGTGFGLASSAALTNFDGTTPFSISIWFVYATVASEASLITTLDAAGGTFQGWEIAIEPTGVDFFLINTFPTSAIDAQSVSPWVVGNLYNIVCSYDGNRLAGGVRTYVNGVSLAVSPATDTLNATSANGLPVRFGARNNGSQPVTFPMAYAEIWTFVLSAGTVAANYAAGPGVY